MITGRLYASKAKARYSTKAVPYLPMLINRLLYNIIKYLVGFMLLGSILPYVVVRYFSAENAVKVFIESPREIDFNGTIRVAAYNIAHGRGGKYGGDNWNAETRGEREARLRLIADFLSAQAVDIVILNEVDFSSHWSYSQNQAEFIARHAGFSYRVEQRNYDLYHPLFKLQFGNAILSRYPINSAELLPFTPLSKFESVVFGNHDGVIAELSLNNEINISIVGLHLEVRDPGSRLKAFSVLEELISRADKPTFLAGDFNAEKSFDSGSDSVIDRLAEIDGVDYFPRPSFSSDNFTFPSEKPSKTLDWIFIPSSAKVLQGTVPQVLWSDHFPVIVEIEI